MGSCEKSLHLRNNRRKQTQPTKRPTKSEATHPSQFNSTHVQNEPVQWRRQDLLRGGTKLEIRSWGTHGKLQGQVQQLLDDY